MGYLRQIDESEATGEAAELYAADRAEGGYVANYTRTFAPRPAAYRAWESLVGAVRAPMTLRRYEVVTLAAARALRSSYCSLAHGAVVAERLGAPEVVEAVFEASDGPGGSPLDAAEQEVVRFAAKVARSAPDITADDVDRLRAQGLSDEDVLDVVLATAARCFFSTVLDATGTLPDAALRDRLDPALREVLVVGRPIDEG
jgi:uncharacterized peroxidase-related enzyme